MPAPEILLIQRPRCPFHSRIASYPADKSVVFTPSRTPRNPIFSLGFDLKLDRLFGHSNRRDRDFELRRFTGPKFPHAPGSDSHESPLKRDGFVAARDMQDFVGDVIKRVVAFVPDLAPWIRHASQIIVADHRDMEARHE